MAYLVFQGRSYGDNITWTVYFTGGDPFFSIVFLRRVIKKKQKAKWIHCETHFSFRNVLLKLRLEDFIQGDQLILIEMEQVVCATGRRCKSETILDLGLVGHVCWLKNANKLSLEMFWEIPKGAP